jgi:hypothetical protein
MCFRPPTAAKKEKKCPKCGVSNPITAEVCKDCGEPLPNVPAPGMPQVPGRPAAPVPGGAVPPRPPAAPQAPMMPPAPPAAPQAPMMPPAPPKKPGE